MSLKPRVLGPGDEPLLAAGSPMTVCIVLLSGIGDVVHGLPLARDVKRVHPGHRVVWVAEPAPAAVLEHHPAVDRIVVYRTRDGLRGLRDLRRAMKGVRADLTLNAQRYVKSVWPTLMSGAGDRVGLPRAISRDGIWIAHTHLLPDGPWKHTQDLFLDFRPVLGVPRDAEIAWDITFSEQERAASRAFFAGLDPGRPTAALVLASANRAKDWPAERYAALADHLAEEHGFQVLLVGGPSAAERSAADIVLERARTAPLDCTGDGVRRMMWLVGGSDLVVSPDTGPLHVAHALGVPVVGLFGHTNPWRVGPYRRFHDLVVDRYTDPGEEPDPSRHEPKDGRMERITVQDVLARVALARERHL